MNEFEGAELYGRTQDAAMATGSCGFMGGVDPAPDDHTKLICTVALWVYPPAAHRSFFVCARKLAQNTPHSPSVRPPLRTDAGVSSLASARPKAARRAAASPPNWSPEFEPSYKTGVFSCGTLGSTVVVMWNPAKI
jgi:hypothetical protein